MQSAREDVFNALFALLKTATPPVSLTWGLVGRRLQHWDNVPPADQPCLFLQAGPQNASQPTWGLPTWKLQAQVFIYFRCDGSVSQDYPPDTLVNGFIDAIETAVAPQVQGDLQTLGGLVTHCYINGEIMFDSGISDQQGVIVIPIEILSGV